MGYVVSIVNMKGGVGKTTITVNLATCLAQNYHKRVLIVDLDTQVNATLSMMSPLDFAKLKQERRTLKTLVNQTINAELDDPVNVRDAVYRNLCGVDGLDILAGDVELYDDYVLSELISTKARSRQQSYEKTWNRVENYLMRMVLRPILRQYDVILIDFPPGDNIITRSALLASHLYLIPVRAEPLAVVGVGLLESRLKQLRESDRAQAKLVGLVYTSRGQSSNMELRVKQRLETEFGSPNIFATEIPYNVEVAKAVDDFKPVVLNAPQSPGAKAFKKLAPEFIQKLAKTVRGQK
ncbi:MAG: ParA family protein [Cyanobacteria bacterium P01_G01_bin.54]